MPHVSNFCNDLWILVEPHGVRRNDLLAVLGLTGDADAVEVGRSAHLQPERFVRLCKDIHDPCWPGVVVAGISSAADDIPASIPDASLVVHVPAARWQRPFGERPDEVHREKLAAEL